MCEYTSVFIYLFFYLYLTIGPLEDVTLYMKRVVSCVRGLTRWPHIHPTTHMTVDNIIDI